MIVKLGSRLSSLGPLPCLEQKNETSAVIKENLFDARLQFQKTIITDKLLKRPKSAHIQLFTKKLLIVVTTVRPL